MSILALMNTTVDLKTETQTKDSNGYLSAPSLSTVTASVPARVTDQTPDRAMIFYGKYDALKYKRIYFASDPALTPTKSWVTWNGGNYAVTSVQNQGGNLDRLWAVDVELKAFGG